MASKALLGGILNWQKAARFDQRQVSYKRFLFDQVL